MNKITAFLLSAISLSACNSVYLKPNTLDASQVFYVDSGGHLMQLGTKEHMEERGYKLTVCPACLHEQGYFISEGTTSRCDTNEGFCEYTIID